jgi:hypothetical protein
MYMMHINVLSIPRPARRAAVLKVFPSADELVPCCMIALAILLGLIAALARIL